MPFFGLIAIIYDHFNHTACISLPVLSRSVKHLNLSAMDRSKLTKAKRLLYFLSVFLYFFRDCVVVLNWYCLLFKFFGKDWYLKCWFVGLNAGFHCLAVSSTGLSGRKVCIALRHFCVQHYCLELGRTFSDDVVKESFFYQPVRQCMHPCMPSSFSFWNQEHQLRRLYGVITSGFGNGSGYSTNNLLPYFAISSSHVYRVINIRQ